MATARQALRAARKHVGYVEGTNNNTKFGKWYGLNFQPWCAMYVSFVMDAIGLGHIRYASCDVGMANFRNGKWGKWIPASGTPRPGDVVFYGSLSDSVHTGVVVSVDGDFIETIEGNTGRDASGSQTNGGGCYRRRRSRRTWIAGYGRPNYTVDRFDFLVTTTRDGEVVRRRTFEKLDRAVDAVRTKVKRGLGTRLKRVKA